MPPTARAVAAPTDGLPRHQGTRDSPVALLSVIRELSQLARRRAELLEQLEVLSRAWVGDA